MKYGDVIRFYFAGGLVEAMVILDADAVDDGVYILSDEGTAFTGWKSARRPRTHSSGRALILGLTNTQTIYNEYHPVGKTATRTTLGHEVIEEA